MPLNQKEEDRKPDSKMGVELKRHQKRQHEWLTDMEKVLRLL